MHFCHINRPHLADHYIKVQVAKLLLIHICGASMEVTLDRGPPEPEPDAEDPQPGPAEAGPDQFPPPPASNILECCSNHHGEDDLMAMRVHECCFLILVLLTSHVSFGHDLFQPSCNTMIPVRESNEPEKTDIPYVVTASRYSYNPGDQITVSLEANNGTYFKEFLLQARTVPGNAIIGHFIVTDPKTQHLTCGGIVDSSVSHINSTNKSHISALWVAPASTINVHFRAIFLESQRKFWVGVESPLLTNVHGPNTSKVLPVITNFAAASNTTTTISNTSRVSSNSPPTHISRDTCGTQKICFSSPSDCDPSKTTNCYFMSSTIISNGAYNFEISGPSDGYVSFGFSDDQLMGNDDIYICGINSTGQVDIQHAHSKENNQHIIIPLMNVEARVLSYTSGVIQCTFSSRNQISTQPPMTQLPSSNISNMYYILVAHGPSTNGETGFPAAAVFASENKVNLYASSNETHKEHGTILVKTHGALMLLAWMTTGSLGMIIARYCKVAAKKMVIGKPIWFESHLVLMTLTVAATITSFVLAFVEAKGWAGHVSTHSILGCIVMILSFIQPFISFIRPSPQSSKRFIFNWFHGINALLIKVLGVANLFLGFQFLNHRIDWLVNVMAGFCGWEGLLVILFEMNASLAQKKLKKEAESTQVSVSNLSQRSQPPRPVMSLIRFGRFLQLALFKREKFAGGPFGIVEVKFEYYLLAIYFCGNLAFLITLFVGIGRF